MTSRPARRYAAALAFVAAGSCCDLASFADAAAAAQEECQSRGDSFADSWTATIDNEGCYHISNIHCVDILEPGDVLPEYP